MIAIKVAGRYVDLPRDTRIRLRMGSQVFAYEFVSQGYTYPISLPYTPANQRAMRHYDRIANTAEFEDIPCTIDLGGLFWKNAVIKYRGFKGGAYDVDLQVPDDQAVQDMRGLRTTDLEEEYELYPGGGFAGLGDFNGVFDARMGDADDTDFIFAPIRNTTIFGDREERYFNYLPADAPEYAAADEYVNYYDADRSQPWLRYTLAAGNPDRWIQEFVPLPYLCKVMDHLLDLLNLRLDGDVFRNAEVRTQVVLNNYLITAGVGEDGAVAFPFLEGMDPIYETAYLKYMVPDLSVVDFILRVCRRYNAVPLFRPGRVMEIRSRTDILNDPRYLEATRWAEPNRDLEVEEADGITLEETEEPTDDARRDNAYDPERIIGTVGLPSELSGLSPDPADLAVVGVNNTVYKYVNSAWVEWADYFPQVSAGNNPSTLDVGVGFTSMFRGEDTSKAGRNWLVPAVEQRLSDPTQDVHALGMNPIEQLRLLFYRGLQQDSTGDTYPLLSNDVYDYHGDTITGALMREALDGANGIFDVWYASWVRVLQKSRTCKKRVRLPLHVLRNFRWDRKLRIDGQHYLCREIDVEFTTTGMGVPVLDLLRLPTAITGVRLPISCAGRGHVTFVVATADLELNWVSTTGYISYRTMDGIITTVGDGSPGIQNTIIPVPAGEVTPLCVFSSSSAGLSTGDISYVETVDGAYGVLELITRYLQDLDILEMQSNALQLEEELDLTQNALLQSVRIPGYPFETIDLSGCPILYDIIADNSALTTIDFTNNPLMSGIALAGCALTESTVDGIFNSVYAAGVVGASIDLSGGTSAAPTAASLTARTWLAANGGTLNHN